MAKLNQVIDRLERGFVSVVGEVHDEHFVLRNSHGLGRC
jgi:hypothetical protein